MNRINYQFSCISNDYGPALKFSQNHICEAWDIDLWLMWLTNVCKEIPASHALTMPWPLTGHPEP